MYFRHHKHSYSLNESPYRRFWLNAYSDKPQDQKHLATLCKSFALNWGEINSQKTLLSADNFRAVSFSCSGHGGIVIFSEKEIEILKGFQEISHKSYRNYNGNKFFIYTLEEDSDWALLPLIVEHPDLTAAQVKKAVNRLFRETTTENILHFICHIVKSVYRYNPSLVVSFKAAIKKIFPNEVVQVYSIYGSAIKEAKERGLERLAGK